MTALRTSRTAVPVGLVVGLLLAACSSGTSAVRTSATDTASAGVTASATDTAGPVDIGGREIYLDCRGAAVPGRPTVILVSGYHDSSDVWNQSDVLSPVGSAVAASVLETLAASGRVCSYDRPGTVRYIEGAPLTDRSTPVTQPRTAADIVAELDQALTAAMVPKPYVLVGHSLGGLLVQLYAQTYPDQIAGVVFVDALSPTIPAAFGDRWAIYRDQLLNVPIDQMPMASMRTPESERVDLDASAAQTLAPPAFPQVPVVVLTKTEPFGGLTSAPGLPAEDLNAVYEQAQDSLVALVPGTPHILATGSDHYIQLSQPDLVVAATDLVLGRSQGNEGPGK
jgi:pimeloyl-ACP methyl ester carboxylesterase